MNKIVKIGHNKYRCIDVILTEDSCVVLLYTIHDDETSNIRKKVISRSQLNNVESLADMFEMEFVKVFKEIVMMLGKVC